MFGDLCFAVWVCKRNWKQLAKGLEESAFDRDVRFLRWMGRFRNRGKAILIFIQYLTQAFKQPDLFYNNVEGSKPTSMNNLQYMKVVLMSKLFMTKEEAMDTAFGEAVFDIAAIGEGEGVCNFVTDGQRGAADIARKMAARRREEPNGEQQRN